MVCDHHARRTDRLGQLIGQPTTTLLMTLDRALRCAATDHSIVSHQPLGSLNGLSASAHQLKVSPEGCTEELHAADGDGFVFQEMDTTLACGLAHVHQATLPVPVVELVVTGDQNDGLVAEGFPGPKGGVFTAVNIAGPHDPISLLQARGIGQDAGRFGMTV